MNLQEINDLIRKYGEGTASEAEIEALNYWYRERAYQDAEFPEAEDTAGHDMLKVLNKATRPAKARNLYLKYVAAASVVLITGVTAFLVFTHYKEQSQKDTAQLAQSQIRPGSNKAILTLANGKKISLTDAANGQIANQNGVQITKAANGQLLYTITGRGEDLLGASSAHGLDLVNTIETPKGGQYQVMLPDGSKVWLNAFSSLKFPLSFKNRNERRVELSGEAYFEVAHNKDVPFRVATSTETVEVLGTHFNVSAYGDDAVTKTTLLEGRVKVSAGERSAILSPGQQARLSNAFIVSEVNTEEVIAWKNGYFNFDDEKLDNIMRSVSRWYNVDVVFQDQNLRNETYGAVTTRFTSITTLLSLMEQTGRASFSIKGKTLIVSKKK